MAPAVLTVLRLFGSKPTLGFPVVTRGRGNGAFFIHQNRYSARAHPCHGGPQSTGVAAPAAAAGAPPLSAAAEPAGAGVSRAAASFARGAWANKCGPPKNQTAKTQPSPVRIGSVLWLA